MTRRNLFKEKAEHRQRQQQIAIRHHSALHRLLARYGDKDDPQARARVAAREQEARDLVKEFE